MEPGPPLDTVNWSYSISLIKQRFPDLRFIDDRYDNRFVVNDRDSLKSLVWPAEETMCVKYVHGRITKEKYIDYLLTLGKTPIVISEIPFFNNWLRQEKISNIQFQALDMIDEAMTLSLLDQRIKIINHDSEYQYACLNGRDSPERRYLIKTLHDNGLIDHGYVTDNSLTPKFTYPKVRYNEPRVHTVIWPEAIKSEYQGVKCSGNFLNLMHINQHIPGKILLQCETQLDFFWGTEKSHQAFALKRIPMTLGNRGYVQKMRDHGFDMYDDIIDHSYDDIEDNFQRIQKCIELNKSVLKNSKDIRFEETAEKNYRHLIDIFWRERLNHLFGEISKLL
jgi:hypothetical protein